MEKHLTVEPLYQPRFIQQTHVSELINLWHLAKIYTSQRHDRLIWTTDQFMKTHSEYSRTGVYKDLCCLV